MSWVPSWLNCCNKLYMGLPLKVTWKLQLTQKTSATMLMGAAR